MTTIETPLMRVSHLQEYGVTMDELAPMDLVPLTQPVLCLHCGNTYPFGESALALDGLIYCPVVGCDGSLIDQMPVVETEQEQAAGRGWQRTALTAQFGALPNVAPSELVWSRAWRRMTPDEFRLALVEAWR